MLQNRSYRKNLNSQVLVYVGGHELEMKARNLSLTGLFAAVPEDSLIHSTEELFALIRQSSAIVDFYLPELRVGGEAEIVRSESDDGHVELAMQFRKLNYQVDNLVYARHAYRKDITVPGYIDLHGVKHFYNTDNVSMTGMKVRMTGKVDVETGYLSHYEMYGLKMSGDARVVWKKHENYTTLMGLEYQYLKQESMQGIPRFLH